MTRRPRHGPRPRTTVLTALSLLLLLAACTATTGVATIDGPDGASATPTASPGSDDPEEAMLAFSDCMREHGIDMPDAIVRRVDGSGGGGVREEFRDEAAPADPGFDPNSEEFQAAEAECRHHLDSLGALEPGDGPELTPEQEEAFLAFTECMREHGIDMPDFGTGGAVRIGSGEEPGFDPRSEEFQAADEACREHLDGLPGGGPIVESRP